MECEKIEKRHGDNGWGEKRRKKEKEKILLFIYFIIIFNIYFYLACLPTPPDSPTAYSPFRYYLFLNWQWKEFLSVKVSVLISIKLSYQLQKVQNNSGLTEKKD